MMNNEFLSSSTLLDIDARILFHGQAEVSGVMKSSFKFP